MLAIIGTRSSGKSNFFGVLLKQLQRRYAGEVGFTVWPQDSFDFGAQTEISSDGLYRRRYGNHLYGTVPVAVPQTRRANTDIDLRIPLIYRLEFPRQGWRGPRAMDLVIFDAAGEDLKDDDPQTLREFGKYLVNAAGIIFLVDPGQVESLDRRLSAEVPGYSPSAYRDDPQALLAKVLRLFEEKKGTTRVPVPIAVAFCKSDMLEHLPPFDTNVRLRRDSNHEGGFDSNDCRQLSDDVARALSRFGETNLVGLVSRFKNAQYFALSALGHAPDPTPGADSAPADADPAAPCGRPVVVVAVGTRLPFCPIVIAEANR